MSTTNSENLIAKINSSVFFKEFTFSKNEFVQHDSKQHLELADNVVKLGDMCFVYQIKEREGSIEEENTWYENKVLKKAVKQIKSTLSYLANNPEIIIENERGHKLDVKKDINLDTTKKIIIYSPSENFCEKRRSRKFYESSECGLIHLFHIEDYDWVCRYLITPAEIDEYLIFREKLFRFDKVRSNAFPEQYFLGHFLETPNADHFNPYYIENLWSHEAKIDEFDMSWLINNFSEKRLQQNADSEYYHIIEEIAKLNRTELIAFKERMLMILNNAGSEEMVLPYRMYVPRTDCAFVFISLRVSDSNSWRTALSNFTQVQKYDCKTDKCIGAIALRNISKPEYYEIFWMYINSTWQYDEKIEKLLEDNNPFRDVQVVVVQNRYK